MCRQILLFQFHSHGSLLFTFVSFCFISFIFFLFLRTGLFHCELHHISGLIVEKSLTLLLQFWRQMVVQRLGVGNQML